MSSPLDLELDAQLADLALALDVPRGDGMAAAVATRVRVESISPAAGPRTPWRRLALAVAAVAAAVVGGLVAAPAVADWFGVRGVEVRPSVPWTVTGPSTPSTGTRPPSGAALDLGTRVATLEEAAALVGFTPVVPSLLGRPDAIWVDRRHAAPFVALVYEDGPLVSAFDATLTEDVVVGKFVGPDTPVERFAIGGEPALWIDGIHEVAIRGRSGDHVIERLRISDAVLFVQHGPLTVRIEGALGRDDAVRIAGSLRRQR